MRNNTLKISLIILSISVIMTMPVAQAQEEASSKLTVTTDESTYGPGDKVVVTISLPDKTDITTVSLTITYNDNNSKPVLVDVTQLDNLKAGETKNVNFKAVGSKWAESNTYTVKATSADGIKTANTAFKFEADVIEPVEIPPDPVEIPPTAVEVPPDPVEIPPDPVEIPPDPVEIPPTAVEVPPVPPELEPPVVQTCAAGEVMKGGECVSICGDGTQFVDGQCTTICGSGTEWDGVRCIATQDTTEGTDNRGGCLIATAAYGTELAPQLQTLREVRDNTLMETSVGNSFMTSFNMIYYTFSPTIADWERQNPAFASAVGAFLTPMISSLSIMNMAEETDASVLALGISVIALNLGIYIGTPIGVAFGTKKALNYFKA